MPFIYPRQKRTFEEHEIRDFQYVDSIVREAVEEVKEWDPLERLKDEMVDTKSKNHKMIYLLNTKKRHPPRNEIDPKEFLVPLCLTKGLNWGEIEEWLDSTFMGPSAEFQFDKTPLGLYIDQRRIYYKVPGSHSQGNIPCVYITWKPDFA